MVRNKAICKTGVQSGSFRRRRQAADLVAHIKSCPTDGVLFRIFTVLYLVLLLVTEIYDRFHRPKVMETPRIGSFYNRTR